MNSYKIVRVGDKSGVFWIITAESSEEAIKQLANILSENVKGFIVV